MVDDDFDTRRSGLEAFVPGVPVLSITSDLDKSTIRKLCQTVVPLRSAMAIEPPAVVGRHGVVHI